MEFDRHCTEIIHQTGLLATELAGADLRAPVPSCPGWTLGALVRHVGGGHRWATDMVRERATDWLPDDRIRDVAGDDSGELPAAWLRAGATELAATLRAAGPEATMFAPFRQAGTRFWARRFAHETVVHRADAALAAGIPFALAPEVAAAGVDEWMELDAMPEHFAITPRKRELLGPGRTLGLAATDADARWFVDLTGAVIRSGRGAPSGRRPAAVTVRAPLTELLLLVYRRRPAAGVAVDGDRALLDRWLDHVAFG